MNLMNYLAILSIVSGIIFLILSFFVKGNSKKTKISFVVVFIVCLILSFILYQNSKPKFFLTKADKEYFRSHIMNQAVLYTKDPVIQAQSVPNELSDLISKVEINEKYVKEMPEESAILYRLYAASILLSKSNTGKDFIDNLNTAYPYLIKSTETFPDLWKDENVKSALNYYTKIHENIPETLDLKELLLAQFTIAMINIDDDKIQEMVKNTLDIIVELAGKPKDDYLFFINYKGKGGIYNTFIVSLKMMIEGQDGKFEGPLYYPMSDGKTKIIFTIIPKNKPQGTIEWVVDKNTNYIEPKTQLAKEIHGLVINGIEK